jgi:hypothetical protein
MFVITDEEHRPMRGSQPHKAAASQLRTLTPPVTPKLILLAILGVLLFLCGIVYGVWQIIRFRRYHADGGTPGV